MNFFKPKPGWCTLSCLSDSRWNTEPIRASAIVVSSGKHPEEVKAKVAVLTESYGEPPEDVEVCCIKD